ncbi:MAG TPA: hypothetical protein V6C76_15640 [Drouetiella sp.]
MANNAEIATPRAENFDTLKEKESPKFDVHDLMKAYRTDSTALRTQPDERDVHELIFPDVYDNQLTPGDRTGDKFKPIIAPSDIIEPKDPRAEGDKRDGAALMDAMRSGKLDDLKNLVADMSPEKLKRVAEQLKADGFDISAKDGKFTIFNKNLGVGVSVDQKGNAEVVRKDKDGNYVKADDGTKPETVLSELSKDLPAEDAADAIKRLMEEAKNKEHRFPKGIPDIGPDDVESRWRRLFPRDKYEQGHDGMLLL